MAKVRVEFELTGLKFKIEGEREDAASISRSLGAQLSSVLQPVSKIVDGEIVETDVEVKPPDTKTINAPSKSRRKKAASSSSNAQDADAAIDFNIESDKYGNPRQQWKTAEKSIWLIYVMSMIQKGDQFTTKTIVDTFNKHFKQAGKITTSNVTRDLGRLKINPRPVAIGEDTTKNPSMWFLTEVGQKKAQALIGEALAPSS